MPFTSATGRPAARCVNVAKLAEEQGFDSVWVGERPTFAAPGSEGLYGIPGLPWPEAYKGMCEPLTAMAAAAAVTERVRIGSSVLVLALHHPVRLAAALATIDQISGGRVVAGIGSGWAPPMSLRLWDQIREKATGHGRGASVTECVVRVNIGRSDQPIDGERQPMVGSVEQVVEDIVETARLGADEPFKGTSWIVDTALETKERVTAACV